jgi:ABC-type nitrate/sulfonate/bicarbonate transport system substrate-binding protein
MEESRSRNDPETRSGDGCPSALVRSAGALGGAMTWTRRQVLGQGARLLGGAVVLGGTGSVLAACGDDDSSGATTTVKAGGGAATQKLTLQAAWINDAEFMGYFLAIDKGLYKAQGIDLTYLPGGPDVIPESSLLSGKADVALTTPDTTIKAITTEGAKFKIIGTQFQKNPIGVVTLKKNNISKPQDLVGKKLAVPPVNTLSVEAMLKINGIDPSKVTIVPYQYDPTPLIKGEVDATIDFAVNVPYTIQQAGADPSWFLLYDFGFTIYNDTVVVTEDTLKNKRDLLVKFLRASRQGWDENFKDPATYPPQFKDTWFKGTGRTVENEIFFNKTQKDLIVSSSGIFTMTDADIDKNIKALEAIGIKATKAMFDTSLAKEI